MTLQMAVKVLTVKVLKWKVPFLRLIPVNFSVLQHFHQLKCIQNDKENILDL